MPTFPRNSATRVLVVMGLVALIVGGCSRSNKDYIPNVSDARTALEAALTAWQNDAKRDEPIQPAGQTGVTVAFFDQDFANGRRLQKWTVESAGTNAEGPRQFVVALTLAGKNQPETATYYVTGVSRQFSVFRDREYALRGSQM